MPVSISSGNRKLKQRRNQFPGLLTSAKLPIAKLNRESYKSDRDAAWKMPPSFSHLKLDGASRAPCTAEPHSYDQTLGSRGFSIINVGSSGSKIAESVRSGHRPGDPISDSLDMKRRGTCHFMIYRGTTLSSTPEFENYRKTHTDNWNAIAGVIREIEDYLKIEEVDLAVIDGSRVNDISSFYSVTGVFNEDLISCITSTRSATTQSNSRKEIHGDRDLWAAILIQRALRNFLCWTCYLRNKMSYSSAVIIQCLVRSFTATRRVRRLIAKGKIRMDERWAVNVEKLKKVWGRAASVDPLNTTFSIGHTSDSYLTNTKNGSKYASAFSSDRLLIFVPSMTSAEYIRLHTDRLHAIQNMHISCLHQLMDPHVHIVYVTPAHLSSEEIAYHESILSVLGTPPSACVLKRLHFVVPEMIDKLPPHLSVSQSLLCSSLALKKIRTIVKQLPNAVLMPFSLSWVDKRLSHYLNVPSMSPDPVIAGTITSRSFVKQVFDEACVTIPLGVPDIYDSKDFYIALSTLVSSNIDIKRWMFRLNNDYNNESYAYLDVEKLSITATLRSEIASMLEGTDGLPGMWYSRHVQLEVRKRVLMCLCAELPSRAVICQSVMHGRTWENFEKHYRVCGLVIEAEPLNITGYVTGQCFIDPNGLIQMTQGVELLVDRNYQVQGYLGPQILVPKIALQGATEAVAKVLYAKYGVIGYLSIEFVCYWDGADESSRLQALGVKLGLSPSFLGSGCTAAAGGLGREQHLSQSMMPLTEDSAGKSFVYIPIAYHRPLCSCRDGVFLRQCKMNGIGFDPETLTGTVFFRIDAMVGGSISTLTIGKTRKKSIDAAIHVLSFIAGNFRKINVEDDGGGPSWECLISILSTLQFFAKNENKNKMTCTMVNA